MEEIWKDIEGYDGAYEVSNLGRVKSVARMPNDAKGRRHPVGERLLRVRDRKGYDVVTLSKDGELKTFCVHRLVAQAFIPNPDRLQVVNHKDENPKNNRADNLEWCTVSYNTSYGTGTARQASTRRERDNYPTKAVVQRDFDGNFIAEFKSLSDASKATGIDKALISKSCKRINRTAGGYVWDFKE